LEFQARRFSDPGGRWAVSVKRTAKLVRAVLLRLHDHAAAARVGGGRGGGCRPRGVVPRQQEHQLPGAQPSPLNGGPPHSGINTFVLDRT